MITSADEIKFRCSSLGHLMTESRSKTETISETTKTHLIDVFVSEMYGRKENITSKVLEKGNVREEDSITLLSRVTKIGYNKNEEPLDNEFIKGTPDIYRGETIRTAKKIIDTKTSWSAHTFFRSRHRQLDKMYYWQVMGYMALTGASEAEVAYCLVNGTAQAIKSEKKHCWWRFMDLHINDPNYDPDNDPEYIRQCQQIERNHIFNMEEFNAEYPWFEFHSNINNWTYDIPMKDRLHIFSVKRDQIAIDSLYERITHARAWMNEILFKNQLQTA